MKRKLCALALCVAMLFVMTPSPAWAGDGDSEPADHEHTTTGGYVYDETGHWYVCDICGQKFDVEEHSYGETYPVWNWAEDYSSATATFICDADGAYTQVVTAEVTVEEFGATCDDYGYFEYTATATLGDSTYQDYQYADNPDAPPLGHEWGDIEWEWDEETFSYVYASSNCLRDPEHSMYEEAKITYEFTDGGDCYEGGAAHFTATVVIDGVTYTDERDGVAQPGHNWDDPVWTWDDEGNATATRICHNDASHTETVDAQVDIEDSVDADCENDGQITYIGTAYFDESGDFPPTDTYIVTIPALGHDWDDGVITTAATCESEGVMTYTCQNDRTHTKTEAIPALGHDWGEPVWTWDDDGGATATFSCGNDETHTQELIAEVTEEDTATCDTAGVLNQVATVTFEEKTYSDSRTAGTTDPLGHDWGEPVWTWSEDGSTATATFTCGNDASHVQVEEASVVELSATAATCEAAGQAV